MNRTVYFADKTLLFTDAAPDGPWYKVEALAEDDVVSPTMQDVHK